MHLITTSYKEKFTNSIYKKGRIVLEWFISAEKQKV
jgi:hypothetical protein